MFLTINNEVIWCLKSPNHVSCPPLLLNVSWRERTVRASALRIMWPPWYFIISPAAMTNTWQYSPCCSTGWYYINITFPARVIVKNIIPRNAIINRGAAEVNNHISRDDIFDFHLSRKCNIYFIIPNRTLDPLFSEVLLFLNRPIILRGDPKGNYWTVSYLYLNEIKSFTKMVLLLDLITNVPFNK